MDYELPEFDVKEAKRHALPFAKKIFGDALVRLQIKDDGACRAIFKPSYFTLQPDHTEPTRSQWSTLKKRIKRHNRNVFIFKKTGQASCREEVSDTDCYYVEFGFFLYT